MRFAATTAVMAGALVCTLAAPQPSADKKLIEFGWDEPDTSFLRTGIGQIQRTPFDGCVFHVEYRKPDGAKGSFTWQGWGNQNFTEQDLKDAFADLRAVRSDTPRCNFLRFNTTPGKLDWFDDLNAVVANARLAAQLARAGRCPGILFDIEQYEGQLFNYRKQRDATSKSWELYASEARKRGGEVMEAFQAGYPGLTVFLTFGYSLPWTQTSGGKVALADCSYGLLAPFLDGMVEATRGRTRLVDGFEISYGYKTAQQFADGRRTVKHDLLPIVRDAEKYKAVFSLGFGVWLDHDWRKRAWDTEDFSKNHFSPQEFEGSVSAALREADEYVWVYSEVPRWWSAEGKSVKLPEAYVRALREARKSK
jgi:hypothetical protein